MKEYRITGIWTDDNEVITHYAVHEIIRKQSGSGHEMTKAKKITKAEAVVLVEDQNNNVMTFLWNYTDRGWMLGEEVYVAGAGSSKFLKTKPDNSVRDNLFHLIDYAYIF